MKLISGWLMRVLFVASIVVVPAASVSAQELSVPSGALVSSVDDTTIALDGDTIVATSLSGTPTVAIAEGKLVKIDFCKTDRGPISRDPETLGIDLELVSPDAQPTVSMSLNFTKIAFKSIPMKEKASRFDGKLLTARDFGDEQLYALDLERVTDSGFRVEMFVGGVFVASADVAGSASPLAFDRLPSSVSTESSATTDDRRGQIAVTSLSWDAIVSARLPDGLQVSFDSVVIYVPESAGVIGTTHVAAIGMTGVLVMQVVVE